MKEIDVPARQDIIGRNFLEEVIMLTKKLFVLFVLLFVLSLNFRLDASQILDKKALLKQAINLFNAADYEKSKVLLKRLIEMDQSRPIYWFNLGNAEFMLENYRSAIRAYYKVTELKGNLDLAARLYIAKSYRKAGKFEKAGVFIRQIVNADFPPAMQIEVDSEMEIVQEELLKEGIEKYRKENYSEALRVFEGVLRIRENENARMMAGLSYLKLGQSDKARANLEKIDAAIKPDAGLLLRQIEQSKWSALPPYWLNATFSGGYDSNVYGDGSSEPLEGKPLLNVGLDGGARLFKERGFSGSISGGMFWEEVVGVSPLRYLSFDLSLPHSYTTDEFILLLSPSASYSILESSSFLIKPGIAASVSKIWPNHELEVAYNYNRNVSFVDIYDYLQGNQQSIVAAWRYSVGKIYIKPYFNLLLEDLSDLELVSGTLPLSNRSYGPGFKLGLVVADSWKLYFNGLFMIRNYDNPSLPGGTFRNDKYFSGYFRIKKKMIHSLSAFLDFSLAVNRSTLSSADVDDKNYNRFKVAGGLLWEVF